MFNPSFNTKTTHPSDDNIRKSRENFPSFGPFFAQGSLPLRSKSTNIMNIPLKSYMGNMEGANSSRVDPVNPRTKVPTPSASTRNVEVRNSIRINGEATAFESLIRRKISATPERREAEKANEKEVFFRTPDPTRNKPNNLLEPLSANRLAFEPVKPPFQSNFPTKSFSTVAIKPGIFNEGLLSRQNEGNNGGFPPSRSRKEQFTNQMINDSFPNLKRITPIPREQRNSINNNHNNNFKQAHLIPFPEKEELPQINIRPPSKNPEGKPLKLEPINSVKKLTENDQSLTTNHPITNPSLNNLFMFQPPQSSSPKNERISFREGSRRSSRNKVRSYDRYEAKSKLENKTGQTELLDPRYLLNQPQILTRRKPFDNSFNKSTENDNSDKITERSITPVKIRTPSTVTKANTPNISIADLRDTKITINFSFKSKAGALPSKPIKTNQDSYIVQTNFAGHKDKYIFGVCDGHGLYGHLVSNYIKHQLPKNIENQYKTLNNEEYSSIKEALTSAFLKTNKELFDSSIDVNFSGSTTIIVLLFNSRLWCANVGDSRAVIGKYRNGQWLACPLSKDHKPDLPKEKERIIASGGRVDTFRDAYGNPVGPSRVWLKDENIPGLAMSRSLGDGVAARAGCIPEPDILQFDLEEEDKFIVIASDGVWEFLSNQQIVDYVAPYFNKNHLESACDKVVREATLRWKAEDDVIDDITCVIISLGAPSK